MSIKMIVTDVDGTLMAPDHMTIPEANIKGYQEASKKGKITVIATGRPAVVTDRIRDTLGCIDYMVTSNGAVVTDNRNKNILYSSYLDKESVKKILDIFDQYPLVYELYAGGGIHANQYSIKNYDKAAGLPKVFKDYYATCITPEENLADTVYKYDIEKINVSYIPPECTMSLREQLGDIPNLVYASGFEGNMEITGPGADKGQALLALVKKLDISMEEVMAFGDSSNDATMMRYAGYSYAMGDGFIAAKQEARHITQISSYDGAVGSIILKVLAAE